jgi:hypothetical protein
MSASAFPKNLRFAMALCAAGLCGACSTLQSLVPTSVSPTKPPPGVAKAEGDVPESEKVVRLPLSSQDLDCPTVDIQDGASSLRVGGAENASVRYQFDISQTARECVPAADNHFSLTVGVSGHLAIGPAGSPGVYSAPLRVTVRREADQQPAYSKVYKVEADTAGAAQTLFQLVSEPIVLPMTRTELADDYSIIIGFDNGPAAKPAPPPKRHPKKANDSH